MFLTDYEKYCKKEREMEISETYSPIKSLNWGDENNNKNKNNKNASNYGHIMYI